MRVAVLNPFKGFFLRQRPEDPLPYEGSVASYQVVDFATRSLAQRDLDVVAVAAQWQKPGLFGEPWERRVNAVRLDDNPGKLDAVVCFSGNWQNQPIVDTYDIGRFTAAVRWLAGGWPVIYVQEDPMGPQLFPSKDGWQVLLTLASKRQADEAKALARGIRYPVLVLAKSPYPDLLAQRLVNTYSDYTSTDIRFRYWNASLTAIHKPVEGLGQPAGLIYVGNNRPHRHKALERYHAGLPVKVWGSWPDGRVPLVFGKGATCHGTTPVHLLPRVYPTALATVLLVDRALEGTSWLGDRLWEAVSSGCPVLIAAEVLAREADLPGFNHFIVQGKEDVAQWLGWLADPAYRAATIEHQRTALAAWRPGLEELADQLAAAVKEVAGGG